MKNLKTYAQIQLCYNLKKIIRKQDFHWLYSESAVDLAYTGDRNSSLAYMRWYLCRFFSRFLLCIAAPQSIYSTSKWIFIQNSKAQTMLFTRKPWSSHIQLREIKNFWTNLNFCEHRKSNARRLKVTVSRLWPNKSLNVMLPSINS